MSAVNLETINNYSMVDALLTIFRNQPKTVKLEFLKRACQEETNALSPELAKQISLAEANFQKGNTVHFDSLDELDEYLDKGRPRKIDKTVDIPNATTIAAMKDVENGVELEDVCVDNVDAFLASVL